MQVHIIIPMIMLISKLEFLTNDGNDTLTISNNFSTQYIADMGAGNDKIIYNTNGTESPPMAEGSYFDGGLGSDTLIASTNADYFGWNSSIIVIQLNPLMLLF